jgi:HPt (histidine-containing phosphotransfer) domain-containing protein
MQLTDLTFLNSFAKGDKEKIAKYIKMFLDAAPGIITNMETHLANNDLKQLRTAAHSLKPQAGYMGFKQGETLLKTIEQCADTGIDVDKIPSHIDSFKTMFEQAKTELTTAL